jgi:hypothetical protein
MTGKEVVTTKRWNGRSFFIAAMGCVAIALALYVFASNIQIESYSGSGSGNVDEAAVSKRYLLTILGHGLIGTAVYLASIGCIVRAIWFVKGDEEKALFEIKQP